MHITLKLSAFVLAGVMLLPSCSTDNLELPSEELYARAFIKEFGLVKPANSFNIATQSKVKVVTQSPTRVKITANVDGREYLFADYSSVDGSQEISFDLPKGVTDIFIRANGKKIPAKVGGTVNLSSKAGRAETSEKFFCNNRISFVETEPRIFPVSDVRDIMEILPEEQPNTNNDGIYSDFSFQAKAGDIMTFYPLFWNTSSHHSLGIYWLDEDGNFEWCHIENKDNWQSTADCSVIYNYTQDLYQTRSGKLTRCNNYDPAKGDENEFVALSGEQCAYLHQENSAFKAVGIKLRFYDNVRFGFFLKVENGSSSKFELDESGKVQIKLAGDNTWGHANHMFFSQAKRNEYVGRIMMDTSTGRYYIKDEVLASISGDESDYKNQKIEYTIPSAPDASIELNHYLNKFFNRETWDVNQWGQAAPSEDGNARYNFFRGLNNFSRAAYVPLPVKDKDGNITRDRTYFAFEDWSNGPIDLNDLIFILDESTVTPYGPGDKPIDPEEPVDPEIPAYEWIIAAEDLGNTYDWDFNDMVVAVSYVTTDDPAKKEIKVRPLAAGGTMPVYLMFDNPATGKTEMIGKELHNWLGGASNAPINVSSNGEEASGETVTIEWTGSEDFSLASHLNKTGLTETVTNMGGFWLLVDKEGKYNASSDFSNVKNDDDSQAVTPNLTKGDSYSPQMICLGGQWCWPQEEQPIHEVYIGFKGWLNDPETVGAKWYGADADFDAARVVTRSSLTNP